MSKLVVQKPKSRYGGTVQASAITPDDLANARRQAAAGKPGKLYTVLDHFLAIDEEIGPSLQSLRSAITEHARPEPMDDSDEAKRQADVLEAVFEELDVFALVDSLLLGHYYGMRGAELVWDQVSHEGRSYQAPTTFEELPQEWIYAEKEKATDTHTTLYVGAAPYYSYDPGAVLLYTARKLPSHRNIDFTQFGVGLAAARFAVFAHFNIEDWAALNEAFGTPTVVGTLLQGWGPADKDLLEQAVMGLASDSRAVISEKTKLELLKNHGDGTNLYDRFLDVCARARARIVKSESLTDHQSGKGSNAAMLTTNGIRVDVARYIARRVERLLNRRLIGPILDRNFNARLARLVLPVQAAEDTLGDVRVARELYTMGVPLSLRQLRERTGFRAPDDDADTLTQGNALDPFRGL